MMLFLSYEAVGCGAFFASTLLDDDLRKENLLLGVLVLGVGLVGGGSRASLFTCIAHLHRVDYRWRWIVRGITRADVLQKEKE